MKTFLLSLLLSFFCISLYALNPSRTYEQLPDKFNMKYQTATVRTIDGGATLNSWYFPSRTETTRLVLISHNGEGNMADHLRIVENFIAMDFNVVIYDYRGYGESSDFEIDNNMYIYPHFLDDFRSMLYYCAEKHARTFFVYGWGIGAGISMGIGYHHREVKGIIADTPFNSIEHLEDRFEELGDSTEVPIAGYDKRSQPLYVLDSNESRSLRSILIIVGKQEKLMTVDEMKAMRAKRSSLIQPIFVVDNPDLKDNFRANSDAYWSRIKDFLYQKKRDLNSY